MKNKKIIALIIAVLFVGFFSGRISIVKADNKARNLYSYMQLYTEVLKIIENAYVDTLNTKELFESSINGMIEETMDPFTTLMKPSDFEELKTSTKGEFGGLGIRISSQGNYITINSVIEGTPANQVGLMAGDKVTKVEGESTKDWDTKKAADHMRGPKGTQVIITVQREGLDEPIDFEITRDIVKIESIPYIYKLDNDIGYIRIVSFNATTGNDLHNALINLQNQGINGLIIDLRSNPGGLLSQAIETVDQFIPRDELVVYTKGRFRKFNREYYSRDDFAFNNIPIVVLINRASASAAEIFSGSLQDYDKALIVGENSFGKGCVQQLFPLPMNYGIKVTTSKYYIKSGRCIHKDNNELLGEINKKAKKDTLKAETEKEIFETVSGRTVYGGGGITPDIFVKQDTLNKYEVLVRSKNLFFKFAVDYLAENDIDENFNVSEKLLNKFVDYIDENNVEHTEEEFIEAKYWLKNSLESQIISNKFGMEAGNKIAVRQDPQLQRVVNLLINHPSLPELFSFAAENDTLTIEVKK
ncbi:MAG: S41 family peptidase [Candidatus Cloacimonadota bacterium]|nr:S41 family peptidase [Candidatus Cloacimonadota bacterium]